MILMKFDGKYASCNGITCIIILTRSLDGFCASLLMDFINWIFINNNNTTHYCKNIYIYNKIYISSHCKKNKKSKEELLLRIYKIIRTGTERSWQSILFLYNERSYTIRNTIYSI